MLGLPAEWAVGTKIQIRLEGGVLPGPLVSDGAVAWRDGEVAGIAFAGLDPDAAPAIADYVSGQQSPR